MTLIHDHCGAGRRGGCRPPSQQAYRLCVTRVKQSPSPHIGFPQLHTTAGKIFVAIHTVANLLSALLHPSQIASNKMAILFAVGGDARNRTHRGDRHQPIEQHPFISVSHMQCVLSVKQLNTWATLKRCFANQIGDEQLALVKDCHSHCCPHSEPRDPDHEYQYPNRNRDRCQQATC